jgi:sodium transport system permease protein
LFRESERLDLRRWLVHVVRDRGETPSFAQGMLCLAVILIVQFFVSVALSASQPGEMTFSYLAQTLLISQLACIFAPTAIMTVMLTRNPRRTLLLDKLPRLSHIAAAAALAVLIHPLAVQLTEVISKMYPVQGEMMDGMKDMERALGQAPNIWVVVCLMALLPAVCEELAMRGFILSGLRHLGHKWWAIALSAVAFGAVHMFLQQKIAAGIIGLVIGYLAVQTEALLPCIIFHAVHNSLAVVIPYLSKSFGPAGADDCWAATIPPCTIRPCSLPAESLRQ